MQQLSVGIRSAGFHFSNGGAWHMDGFTDSQGAFDASQEGGEGGEPQDFVDEANQRRAADESATQRALEYLERIAAALERQAGLDPQHEEEPSDDAQQQTLHLLERIATALERTAGV